MSSIRQDLIDRGLLKPLPDSTPTRPSRTPSKTPEERVAIYNQTESLAKQLYNVFVGVLVGVDENEREDYEALGDDIKNCYRAQAKYVLSTFNENEKLRARVKELTG